MLYYQLWLRGITAEKRLTKYLLPRQLDKDYFIITPNQKEWKHIIDSIYGADVQVMCLSQKQYKLSPQSRANMQFIQTKTIFSDPSDNKGIIATNMG
jgi:hypothetical protein